MGVTANARSMSTLSSRCTRTSFGQRAGGKTRAFFDSVPVFVRPLVIGLFRRNIRAALRLQGTLRHSDNGIMAFGFADWAAILGSMSEGALLHRRVSEQYRCDALRCVGDDGFHISPTPDRRLSAHTAQVHGVRRAYDGKILS